jgi:hypothetical protein
VYSRRRRARNRQRAGSPAASTCTATSDAELAAIERGNALTLMPELKPA